MKIVCDACSAKYSIADEKVKGKVFKIRCKKCSNEIVVRGNAAANEPAVDNSATRVHDYAYDDQPRPSASDPIWHIVIDGEQVGPISAGDVRSKIATGHLDGESYIWKEGFADWMPLSQVTEFADATSSSTSPQAPTNVAAPSAAANYGAASRAYDPAGEESTRRYEPSYTRPTSQPDPMGDLFGTPDAPAQEQVSSKLRGERNENSVLFSLGSLTAMAQPKAVASSASSPSTLAPSKSSVTEGSGLIDIRSLAAAVQAPRDTKSPMAPLGVGSMDDLPVFTSNTFNEPAVILAPMGSRGGGSDINKKLLMGLIGLVAVLVAVVIYMLVRGGGSNVADNNNGQKTPAVARKGAPDAAPAPAKDKVDAATAVAKVDKPDAVPAVVVPPDTAQQPDEPPVKVAANDKTAKKTPPTKKEPKEPVAVKEPAHNSGTCDQISCMVNDSDPCCKKFKKKEPAGGGSGGGGGGGGGGDSSLPESLSRTMVSEGISKVAGKMSACDRGIKGEVKLKVKVAANGSVSSATVASTPDASLGNCVASAMQKATFGKTQNGGSFSYPKKF